MKIINNKDVNECAGCDYSYLFPVFIGNEMRYMRKCERLNDAVPFEGRISSECPFPDFPNPGWGGGKK